MCEVEFIVCGCRVVIIVLAIAVELVLFCRFRFSSKFV